MKHEKIVGLGEILWDIPATGKVLGGAPANFAYHASRFGYETVAASAIGNDQLGQELLDDVRAKGLNCLLSTVGYPTGTVEVSLDDKGIPSYCITENVAWDNIPFTENLEALARETKVVCFGSLAQRSRVSQETIMKFMSSMPEDSLKVFDINLRQSYYSKDVIGRSLDICNILKINDEELTIIAELFDLESKDEQAQCRELLARYNLEMVILTKGEKGSAICTADEWHFLATPKVDVISTVGAGDSFIAAFISGILQNRTIAEAHRWAVDLSAFVCTCSGAMPEYKSSDICR